VTVAVSNVGTAMFVAGAEIRAAVIVPASPLACARNVCVTATWLLTDEVAATAELETASVSAVGAAFAETAENPPRVSATAATAAMRLKLVFVDIIFLSEKVDLKNFFISAWPFNTDS
jgi:hypothetical protein